MCFGSTNKAQKKAQKEEEQRRAEIEAATRRIEGIFSSPERQQQYQDLIGSHRDYLQSDLDRTHRKNVLQTKFATARSGLSGGSVDVDRQSDLAETYLRGVAEAERMAQNKGAQLMADDQSSKQQLISQLLAGADATTAAQNAAQMMRSNALNAKNDSVFNAFDSLFGGFGDIYKQSREAAGERRASAEFGSLFGPRPRTQTTVAGGI
jgi:hypothetical protein